MRPSKAGSPLCAQGEGIGDVAAALCLCYEAGCEFRYLSGHPFDMAAFIEAYGVPYRPDMEFQLYGPPRTLSYLQGILRRR